MPVPFMQASLRRGKAYTCSACRGRLRTSKANTGLAVAVFASASYAGREFGFLVVLCLLLLLTMYEWLTVRVTLDEGPQFTGPQSS